MRGGEAKCKQFITYRGSVSERIISMTFGTRRKTSKGFWSVLIFSANLKHICKMGRHTQNILQGKGQVRHFSKACLSCH